jgi:threonine synthase
MPGIIERYHCLLPLTDKTPSLSLGEGSTPLIRADHLGELIGCRTLYLKYEGTNPTGSFKDRGMVVAVAKALEGGARAIICASTGNTAASAAAYAAHAGIRCHVLLPAGAVASGKLVQALLYGAQVIAIEGSFDDALCLVRMVSTGSEIALVNSINPYRLEGQKTAAFEIVDALGRAPDILAIPVGNAGNITAYWQGFYEYYRHGLASALPQLWGFQAEGAAPLAINKPFPHPQTIASAIRIGNPARGAEARAAVQESGGHFGTVSDEQILEAYRLLASQEGIFCEPASAAPIAGLLAHVRSGQCLTDLIIVAVLTGNGLKDPDIALAQAPKPITIPAQREHLLALLEEQG